jgi:DNA-directed RNA polymerase alpha subunit
MPLSVDELDFSIHSRRLLAENHIDTVETLLQWSKDELLTLLFSEQVVNDICVKLEEHGLCLPSK